jgi:hypothetical protein
MQPWRGACARPSRSIPARACRSFNPFEGLVIIQPIVSRHWRLLRQKLSIPSRASSSFSPNLRWSGDITHLDFQSLRGPRHHSARRGTLLPRCTVTFPSLRGLAAGQVALNFPSLLGRAAPSAARALVEQCPEGFLSIPSRASSVFTFNPFEGLVIIQPRSRWGIGMRSGCFQSLRGPRHHSARWTANVRKKNDLRPLARASRGRGAWRGQRARSVCGRSASILDECRARIVWGRDASFDARGRDGPRSAREGRGSGTPLRRMRICASLSVR